MVSIKKQTKVTQIASKKKSIETRPRSFSLKINKKLSPSLISQSPGVDEEDGFDEEDRKKALVIIYKKHSHFFTCKGNNPIITCIEARNGIKSIRRPSTMFHLLLEPVLSLNIK